MQETPKRLTQTRLDSYFSGCAKLPIIDTPKQKNRKSTKKRSNVRSKLTDAEENKQDDLMDLTNFKMQKRKLPVAICSDSDSDAENSPNRTIIIKQEASPKKVRKVTKVSLNKPNGASTPEKKQAEWHPIILPSTSKASPIKASPSTVRILHDITLTPPSTSQAIRTAPTTSPTVKDETKKVNYQIVKTFGTFNSTVLKSRNLKSLLSSDYRAILKLFFSIERDFQFTLFKLFMWKPAWYNIFKYVTKIGLTMSDAEVVNMYNYFKSNNLVDTNYLDDDLFSLLNNLDLRQLKEIQTDFRLAPSRTKADIIHKLLQNCSTQATLTCKKSTEDVLKDHIEKKMGFSVRLSKPLADCLYQLFVLNTFTSRKFCKHQDYFNTLYLNVVYPPYVVEEHHIFYTRDEFLKFAEAIDMKGSLETAIDRKNYTSILAICREAFTKLTELQETEGTSFDSSRPPYLERFTAIAQYVTILSMSVKDITSKYYEDVKIWLEYLISQNYCKYKRGYWMCHLSLIFTKYFKEYETAAKLIINSFETEKDNLSELQLYELANRGKILNKKTYKLAQYFHDKMAALSPALCCRDWPQVMVDKKAVRSNEAGRKRKYVVQNNEGKTFLSVEESAMDHYREDKWEGVHCEGSLILSSFCLFFWDIIYDTYVKGTFVSRVQNAPLDMYTKYFYINRESQILTRIQEIQTDWSEDELKERLINNFNNHSHESTLCKIDLHVEDPQLLFKIVRCVGREALGKMFLRLATDYRVYSSGFPDLLLWNFQTQTAKFVEVKGENDKLSIKQKLWLNFMMDAGVNVEVCHIHSTGSKKKSLIKKKEQK